MVVLVLLIVARVLYYVRYIGFYCPKVCLDLTVLQRLEKGDMVVAWCADEERPSRLSQNHVTQLQDSICVFLND